MLYHHASGKTHLLNEGSVLLLQQVLLEPKAPADTAVQLASRQGAIADDQFHIHITELLARFEELGLVERVSP